MALTKEEKISKLIQLINEGRQLLVTKSYERENLSFDIYENEPIIGYYKEVDYSAYPGWRINSLATLESFLTEKSSYVQQFKENCKPDATEHNLNQGIGVLEAAKKGYEDNLISEENPILSPNSDVNKQPILRRLFNEFAKSLANSMTFNQIAKVFFESGIIDIPEKPYGNYQGSKSDYVLEKLLNAQNKTSFPEMLSAIQFDLCYSAEGPALNDTTLVSLMKLLGYKTQDQKDSDWDPSLIAPEELLHVSGSKEINKRISLKNLPININELIDELNDNIERKNLNACALLIRKILTLSCFIALDKVGKSNLLDDKELNDTLSIVQQELKISQIIMAKVKSSKWIGDSANHSYKIKINESDVEVAVTGLRIFLEEIF